MSQRTALVTGASTGIGAAIAAGLAARGYEVFAGVRRPEDAKAIEGDRIKPVMLDVTDTDSILAVREQVLAQTGGRLDAVVNNAGIALYGPLEFLPLAQVREQFEVNVFGPVAMIQAFLPALREARGRIVNIGSISGRFAGPFGAPYSSSKFALRAINDALRLELHPFGIEVSLVSPGAIATPIWEKSKARTLALLSAMPAAVTELYTALRALEADAGEIPKGAADPELVVDAVVRALWDPKPRAEYLVGRDARVLAVLAALPNRLRERLIRTRIAKAMKAAEAGGTSPTPSPSRAQTQS